MKPPVKSITLEAAMALLPSCKPTTLDRMRDTAFAESSRIENSQLTRMVAGLLAEPMPEQIAKRDDLLGIVRLLDRVMSDQVILDRLKTKAIPAPAPPIADVAAAEAPAAADDAIVAVDEEVQDA